MIDEALLSCFTSSKAVIVSALASTVGSTYANMMLAQVLTPVQNEVHKCDSHK